MADADDILALEQEAAPAAEQAAQASLPATPAPSAAPATADETEALVTPPSAVGEDTVPAEVSDQASLPIASAQQGTPVAAAAPADDSDDDDSTSPSTAAAAQPASPMSKAIDSAIQNPQVRQYLKDKYGFGSELDDAALKSTQDAALRAQNFNQFNRSLDNAGLGFAQLGAGADWSKIKGNQDIYDQQAKLNQQPVENLLARRQGILQNQALTGDQLKNQALQSSVQQELALSDPNSQESRAAQVAYLPILKKAGVDTSLLQNASASAIKAVLQQPLEFADKQKQAELLAQSNADLRKATLQAHQDQQKFLNGQRVEQFNDKQVAQTQAAFEKDPQRVNAAKSNDSINSALDTLNLAQTNPAAYQAQALDVAKSVLAGSGKLNQSEIKAFAGGSQAFTDRLNQIYQQGLNGTITPENAQFSKQLLQHIQDKNNQTISQREDAIAGQLTARNNGNFDANKQKITGKQSTPQQNSPTVNTPLVAPTASHPQDQQAIQWAQSNPNDPRSAQILKANGM